MTISIIILAAGEGSRMYSDTPKVLHLLAGKPLLARVIETAQKIPNSQVHVVYGYAGETVREALQQYDVAWVEQVEQLGTGHAVAQALPAIPDHHQILVLYGDVPLIDAATLQNLLTQADHHLALLTAHHPQPDGYGRIIRDTQGQVYQIIEQKDALPQHCQITEINTGILAAPAGLLRAWVNQLDNQNTQREYYLTDVVALSVAEGIVVDTLTTANLTEVQGVNNRLQLAQLERAYQLQQAQHLLKQGVMIADPSRFDLRGSLEVGRDVWIDTNVLLEGHVVLGDRVQIGPNTVIRNSVVGNDVTILSHCVIENTVMGNQVQVGPFARLRPETRLANGVRIGNFVEIKKAEVDEGSKINHLSYVGDAIVGKQVNIGAGTITCNYDGANKHQTIIGDYAFIGSDTQLVAPVTIGAGATIGAGTTLTSNAPEAQLTLSRAPQKTISGWERPKKHPH